MQKIKKNTKPLSRLLHFTEALLASKGGYLADNLYTFKHTPDGTTTLEAQSNLNAIKLRWLVLGREHYFETSKEYPIANKRELQRALRFDDNLAPFTGINFQQIARINEQSHRVTFWVVKPQVLECLAVPPWLLFPESYLLAQALDDNIEIASIERAEATLFVSKVGKTLSSGLQSPYTPNLQHFAFSTGSAMNRDNSQHYPTQTTSFTELLVKGLKALSLPHFSDFFVKTEQQTWQNYPWKKAGIISGVFFAVYLALSSAWLVYQQQQLQAQLTAQSSEVDQALSLQKQFKQAQQWQRLLTEPLQDLQPYWNVWPVVLETLNTGARLSGVHYKGDLVTLRGETNKETKATDILAKLAKNTKVLSAKFASPVKAYRGKERFTISFSFAKQEQPKDLLKDQPNKPLIKQQNKLNTTKGVTDASKK